MRGARTRCAALVAVAVLAPWSGPWSGQWSASWSASWTGASVLAAQAAPRVLEVDDMFRLRSVGSPRVSPDGRWVAYTVGTTDLAEDGRESRLWMAPVAGGEALPMSMEGMSVGSPRWSPDGKWLSFTASRDGGRSQVWGLDRRGGEAQQLTRVKQGVGSYAWSPDGRRLLLSIRDERPRPDNAPADTAGADTAAADPADGDGGDDGPMPYVIDRLQFKRDYTGYLDRRRNHLYVWELDNGALTRLTEGDYDHSGAEWSPDGRRVVFVSNRTEEPDGNQNTDLWVVDVPGPASDSTAAAARPVPTPSRLTTNPGSDGSPAWSPDGRWIAYTRTTRPAVMWYEVNELVVIPSAGGEPRPLLPGLDRNVSGVSFAPDGRLWFTIEDSGEEHLARVGTDGRGFERVVHGERAVYGPHIGASGTIAMLIAEPHRPAEVHVLDRDTPRRVTTVNDEFLAGVRLGEVRNFHTRSADGTEIEGWITLPPDHVAGRRYPTLLRIHGGPVAQYDWGFDLESQVFAAHGYVVVRSNPRGSSGYGEAFSHAIFADWGNLDYTDVMAAVDHAIAEGYADPDRLGVGGWSYGGILTNYVITKTDRFAAAITGASEVFYRANYGHDHYQYHWETELGLPWETPEAWDRISPFTYVANITTPTLVIGGAVDWNVPILNSEQLYQALKRLGRETVLVVYPDEHHGIRRPSFQKDRAQRYLDWYDRYLKREPGPRRADWQGALDRLGER